MYEYRATITRVIDGDTVEADVDLGFHTYRSERFRLYGINAPETKGDTREAGRLATQHLIDLLSSHAPTNRVTIQTKRDKQEKYGRYLAVLIANGVNINQRMVEDGHAVVYLIQE